MFWSLQLVQEFVHHPSAKLLHGARFSVLLIYTVISYIDPSIHLCISFLCLSTSAISMASIDIYSYICSHFHPLQLNLSPVHHDIKTFTSFVLRRDAAIGGRSGQLPRHFTRLATIIQRHTLLSDNPRSLNSPCWNIKWPIIVLEDCPMKPSQYVFLETILFHEDHQVSFCLRNLRHFVLNSHNWWTKNMQYVTQYVNVLSIPYI